MAHRTPPPLHSPGGAAAHCPPHPASSRRPAAAMAAVSLPLSPGPEACGQVPRARKGAGRAAPLCSTQAGAGPGCDKRRDTWRPSAETLWAAGRLWRPAAKPEPAREEPQGRFRARFPFPQRSRAACARLYAPAPRRAVGIRAGAGRGEGKKGPFPHGRRCGGRRGLAGEGGAGRSHRRPAPSGASNSHVTVGNTLGWRPPLLPAAAPPRIPTHSSSRCPPGRSKDV